MYSFFSYINLMLFQLNIGNRLILLHKCHICCFIAYICALEESKCLLLEMFNKLKEPLQLFNFVKEFVLVEIRFAFSN